MQNLPSAILLLLGSATLAGCAVGPNYVAPHERALAVFMGGAAVEARATPVDTADLLNWWRSFDDPILTSLVEQALVQNLDVQQAVARVTQARASLKKANAALLASGQVSGQVGDSYQSLRTPVGRIANTTPGFQRNSQIYEVDLGARWEIDAFGGLSRSEEVARDDLQASQATAVASRLAVAAETADTYIAIRGLQERIAIARSQVETQQRLVDTVALQYREGVAAELQLRQSEGALAPVKASVSVLENSLDVAMNALDVLVGMQPGTNRTMLEKVSAIPVPPRVATAGGPAGLLRRRPDIIAAERLLAASNARIGAAIAEYYPKFSLSGLLGTATTSAGGFFGSASAQGAGAFGLRWRLFDFGRVDAEIKGARGRNAEALAAYRLTVLRASEDVEDAFSALVKREAQEKSLADGERSLTRARQASFAAYKGGVVSLIEVLDADIRLLATRDARAQAKAESARAAVASFRALGGGWVAPVAAAVSGPGTRELTSAVR